MKVLLEIKDHKAAHLLKILNGLSYVKVKPIPKDNLLLKNKLNQKPEAKQEPSETIYSKASKLEQAAEVLFIDYVNDAELTAFSSIDLDDFYETR